MSRPKLRDLKERAALAKREYLQAVMHRLRPGMTVHVVTGDRETKVQIVRVGYGDRICVWNPATEAQYLVNDHRLAEIVRGEL